MASFLAYFGSFDVLPHMLALAIEAFQLILANFYKTCAIPEKQYK